MKEKRIVLCNGKNQGFFSLIFEYVTHLFDDYYSQKFIYYPLGVDNRYCSSINDDIFKLFFDIKYDYNDFLKAEKKDWFVHYNIPERPNENQREIINKLIHEYLPIKSFILEKVDDFMLPYKNKKILGIHKRGTDHWIHGQKLDLSEYIIAVNKELEKNNYDYIFLATDEYKTRKIFKEYFKDKLIYYPSKLLSQNDHLAVHYGIGLSEPYLMGEEVLIESLILSKCDKLIKTVSSVSHFAIFYNLDLEYIELDKDIIYK